MNHVEVPEESPQTRTLDGEFGWIWQQDSIEGTVTCCFSVFFDVSFV